MRHQMFNRTPEASIRRMGADETGGVPADLAIVEFDDQGVLWDRAQLEAALGLIEESNGSVGDGTLVVVYIHGWRENADACRPTGAVARFREAIRRNAARQPVERLFAADRVVGVFLGWRGASSRIPVWEHLTFWDRRRTGERIASVHMHETLLRIMHTSKRHPGSKCFVVGHSMGGMIIGKTMSPALTSLLLGSGGGSVHLPVDLVMLQNPAMEALASWQFIDLLKRFGARLELRSPDGSVRPAAGPLIASITSEADVVTSRAYPFGRSVGSLGMSFREDHGPGEPSQRALAMCAIGHVGHLNSHRAYLRGDEVVIERIPGAFNDTPFWVIRVSREISKDHGDVRNPVYARMIEQIIRLNDVERPGLETRMAITIPGGSARGGAASGDAG